MRQTPWMLLCSPHSPQVVWPGHLVTDRTNPQNYFTKKTPVSTGTAHANLLDNIEVLSVETPSLIESLSKNHKLSFSLGSFASQYFSRGEARIEHLKAAQATCYLLIQADVRLDELSADDDVQDWLEKKINRDKKKVWLITGVVTLLNAERVTSNFKDLEVGVGGAVPVLAAAGVPLPVPDLDLGADVRFQRTHGNARTFGIPDEKVFEIQFTRVKLKSRKGQSLREGLRLGSKPQWKPQWTSRSAAPGNNDEADGDEEDYESAEDLEALEASLGDESDEETSIKDEKSLESPVWAQQMGPEGEAETTSMLSRDNA